MKQLMLLVIMCVALTSCRYKYVQDNLVEEVGEEAAETVIKSYTGADVDLDFSPATPEKGFSPKGVAPFVKVETTPDGAKVEVAPSQK